MTIYEQWKLSFGKTHLKGYLDWYKSSKILSWLLLAIRNSEGSFSLIFSAKFFKKHIYNYLDHSNLAQLSLDIISLSVDQGILWLHSSFTQACLELTRVSH